MTLSGLARKTAKAAVIPAAAGARRSPDDVVILLYHRVGAGRREIDLPVAQFERQFAALADTGRVVSLEDAIAEEGSGGVVLTFDDGYRDFHDHVLPRLVRANVPATLFLATGTVDGPAGLSWTQVIEAASTGLVTVGAHTHNHVDLSRVDPAVAEGEMTRSKEVIEDRLGLPCRHFAYPWAVGSPTADRLARALFSTAALDAWRTNRRGRIDPYRLGRTPVLRSDGRFFFRLKSSGRLDAEAIVYRSLRRGPWRRA